MGLTTIEIIILAFAAGGLLTMVLPVALFMLAAGSNYEPPDKAKPTPGDGADASALFEDATKPLEDCVQVEHEPCPVTTLDWSRGTGKDLDNVLDALNDAGLCVHPYPQNPHSAFHDEWGWSDEHAGLWTTEPEWTVVVADGSEAVVEPATDDWEPNIA